MPGGACCWTGVCCDPPRQGVALASHLNIPLEAAQAVAGMAKGEGHVLIPRALPAPMKTTLDDGDLAFREAAEHRLERLHRLVQTEMKAIFIELGHDVEAG
jgi:hypothetical protein